MHFQKKNGFGDFTEATSFAINPAGFIYVTDAGENELIKLDTLGNVLIKRGGYGWTNATFDNPVHVFAQTLRIAVSDKNNHRITRPVHCVCMTGHILVGSSL